LLVSGVGVMDNVIKAVSLEAKFAGDLVYVLGETHDELGGSEYYAMKGEQERGEAYIGNAVPRVNAGANKKVYKALHEAMDKYLVASAIGIDRGGLATALTKTAMGGKKGMEVSLENLPGTFTRDDNALFSESQGRFVVTINPKLKHKFEEIMEGTSFAQIGVVTESPAFTVKNKHGKLIAATSFDRLLNSYRSSYQYN
jgi:phosphoribosylformylglycinamidine synthase